MDIRKFDFDFTVCQLAHTGHLDLSREFYFLSRTEEEISLVCKTEDAPADCLRREDGWRAFRIEGILDFSLIGILSELSSLLAREGIGLFAISTFNTDYILVKKENFPRAIAALAAKGYNIL